MFYRWLESCCGLKQYGKVKYDKEGDKTGRDKEIGWTSICLANLDKSSGFNIRCDKFHQCFVSPFRVGQKDNNL